MYIRGFTSLVFALSNLSTLSNAKTIYLHIFPNFSSLSKSPYIPLYHLCANCLIR